MPTILAAGGLGFIGSHTCAVLLEKGFGESLGFSDKDYRDNDRNEALQLLLDFTVKFAGDLGFKYSWAVAHENMLLKKYEKSGFAKFGNPCYELVKKY